MRLRFLAVAATLLATAAAPATASAPPKRVVALSPFTANTLADLGVRPVGIGNTLGGTDRFSSRLAGVPRLTLSHPNGPNLEQLATLNPQVVLSSPTWNRGHAAMQRLGMRVEQLDPTSVADVPRRTRAIGALVGRSAAGRALAKRQRRDIRAARAGIRKRPSVLLVLGVGRTPYAFLPDSWGGDVVTKAGGRLLTAGLSGSGGFAKISNETVVARDPDVIIAVPHGNARDIPSVAGYLANNPAWRTTRAVRRGHVYLATGNSLLQAYTDAGRIIRDVRTKFLLNG
jgi:iron complex transport system substrate-binding protein